MELGEVTEASLYRAYRAEIEGEPLKRALVRAAFVLMVINTAFILVDWVVYPDKMVAFLPVRIGLDVCLAAIIFRFCRTHPVAASFATSFAGGAMLFVVVLGTGGASSDYYVGLVLLVIGIGVLAPLSLRQGALAIGTLFSIYTVIPLVSGGAVEAKSSALNLFFLGAAAFVGVMSCSYLDKMRFSDFKQKRELQKASEELQELDREKSRFTANVHHELRTPLTLMLAPIDMFLSGEFGPQDGEQRRYLESMQKNGRRLLKLINNLLDLAKIEGDQLEIRRKKANIGDLVQEIVSGAQPFAEQKGIRLDVDGFSELPDWFVDRDAIEKVVVNLVGNALKFSQEGGSVTVSGAQPTPDQIQVSVADDGLGLEENQLEKIFDRFAQADSSNTRKFEGTGIGLALARELVALHGGRIWAESEGLGKGATIRFLLPLGEADEELEEEAVTAPSSEPSNAATSPTEAINGGAGRDPAKADLRFVELERNAAKAKATRSAETTVSGGRNTGVNAAKVLVVDDNQDMRLLLADILGAEYSVILAANGRAGLEEARRHRPDLVLTDVMMPEMSGTELCAEIKADSVLKHVPVILVTSKAEREMKIAGLERGADDYVTKPFHPRELLARVGSLVRVHELQQQLAIQNARLESTNVELESTLIELRDASARLVESERLAAVGELAAGIAHEVNNPVNFAMNAMRAMGRGVSEIQMVAHEIGELARAEADAVAAMSQKIQQQIEDLGFSDTVDSLSELVEIVTEGLDRTHRLVDDLKNFASPGSDVSSDVDIERGITSTIQLLSHTMRDAGIAISTSIEPNLPRIEGNSRALNQVFLNLFKNAVEAMADCGGNIEVAAQMEDSDICVSVRDDGPGVPEEDLARLFEPFFSRKAAGTGSGLGLAISKRIVAEFGGTISVRSQLNQGSEFVIRLPISEREGGRV